MKKFLVAVFILASFFINTSSVHVKADSGLIDASSPQKQTDHINDDDGVDILPRNNTVIKDYVVPATSQPAETNAPPIVNTTPEAIQVEPIIETITLSFAGDCTIGDDEKYTWNSFDEIYHKVEDPSYFLGGVRDIFAADDFTFVNLEGAFTRETKKAQKEFRFKGDPAYVDILVRGSVEGVTLANNHTMDYLEKGFEDTVNTLNTAGIAYAYFDTYITKEIKGMTIGYLGYKCWSFDSWCNSLLVKQVRELKALGADFIVANYHWGQEKSNYPNETQKNIAHFAIDNGVDLVIGHHPHVLQGLETYKGKNILYSLGNFCYGGSPNPFGKDTMIYQHIIKFDASAQSITETTYKTIPARVTSDPSKNDYRPIIATDEDKKRISELFSEISKGLSKTP